MRKLAIFVEGQTELLFLDRLVRELAEEKGLAIEHAEATGGATRARHVRVLKQPGSHQQHRYYVLLVNCGGDSRVKSDILERHRSLSHSGFSTVLGLRDVYGQFRLEDVPRLRAALHQGLPPGPPEVEIFLSIMEIEAWFIAEHTHFKRLNPGLTLERVRQRLRFDPARDDLRQRWHPAADLDRIYQLGGFRYGKQRTSLERTFDLMDFRYFVEQVTRRFADAQRLVERIREELSG